MAMLKILTERQYNQGISRQVVYEWEEDFIETLGLSFEYMDTYKNHVIARIMRKAKFVKPINWLKNKDKYIFFAMNIDLLKLVTWYIPNVLPIVLDVTITEIDDLYKLTKNLPVFWVTSMAIFDAIKDKYPDCVVQYIPQTVSKRYLSCDMKKDISFIQFGRRNPVLHKYALQFCDEHRGISYIYRHTNPIQGMVEYKDGRKTDIGIINTREEFMSYLLRSKISLCSSPLIDNTRDFGKGIDFLTARWYESIACRSFVIARLSEVVWREIEYTQMVELVDSIKDYEQFVDIAGKYLLDNGREFDLVKAFCDRNAAHIRAKEIYEILNEKNVL